jgi:hypothetical protein
MNAELESRPTSTGMRLRLVWRTARNAPGGLDRIREKLRQTVDAWSVEDRATVGAFLQEEIAREYADNPAAGRTEQLTRALDYRTWHEFAIQRLQDGQWRTATGPASGGERVCSPRRRPTTSRRATPTRRDWWHSTRRSRVWTTTRAPSAWGCWRRSTWTW